MVSRAGGVRRPSLLRPHEADRLREQQQALFSKSKDAGKLYTYLGLKHAATLEQMEKASHWEEEKLRNLLGELVKKELAKERKVGKEEIYEWLPRLTPAQVLLAASRHVLKKHALKVKPHRKAA